ncbi:MAG: Transcriptional repressor NrdR [Verrucomicrobia subdivision 3 bacterium]|nr:Transcriptional repressor NrdR [Limisphaerales bacterium]MCS1417153.1 Transcriptional repressor NrdR [Limisphaerales bacterium]
MKDAKLKITDRYEREIPSLEISGFIRDALCRLDEVAYVQFASVYHHFAKMTFVVEVWKLEREL